MIAREEERFGHSTMYRVQSRAQKMRKGQLDDPVVSAVDEILYLAIAARASDIHVHLQGHKLVIRLRIDGVLQFFQEIVGEHAIQVLARLKILAHLDTSDIRLPQDGKCTVLVAVSGTEKMVDLRFATIPAQQGEKLLIRILDTTHHFLTLQALGLSATQQLFLERLTRLPYGFVITTGPTGSGKTTTLYALLAAIDPNAQQIVTLEDPVEYTLQGVVQSQVNPKIGFSFEQGLRALLRQDPDVIMIGEIRDRVTAHIALEAALTGHLVLSTLHTRDSIGAIVRLREMGIENYLLAAALTAVVGQRIVRRLCEYCKVSGVPTTQENMLLERFGYHLPMLYRPQGCSRCFQTGYYGRIGIYELFLMNDDIREGISKNASQRELLVILEREGFTSFIADGLSKVVAGFVAFEELALLID